MDNRFVLLLQKMISLKFLLLLHYNKQQTVVDNLLPSENKQQQKWFANLLLSFFSSG